MPKRGTKTKSKVTPEKKAKKESADDSDESSGGNGALCKLLTDPGWKQKLQNEFTAPYFKTLETTLEKEFKTAEVFPPKELIFNAFNTTPFDKVKVLILGQDPYHDNNQAHGLCFSVPKGIATPPSLKNMYKELATDIDGFTAPDHGCLEKWAEQGILLLNATLTVEAHKPNSHAGFGWQTFTDAVIKTLSDEGDKIVFILWGGFAKKKAKLIDAKKHCVIQGAHPSPLSVKHFLGCKHFSQTNDALKKFGKTPINWSLN